MTDLLTLTIRAIAPAPDSTLSKPEKGDRDSLILCKGDGLNPLIAKLLSCLSPRQLFEFVRLYFCQPLFSPVLEALRLSETGFRLRSTSRFFTPVCGPQRVFSPIKPGSPAPMPQSYLQAHSTGTRNSAKAFEQVFVRVG
jgi:hypothetical protein